MQTSINPATEAVNGTYATASPADIEDILAAAVAAQQAWRFTPVAERAALLTRLAQALRNDLERCAMTITREMGKPIREARAEVEKSAVTLDYYAANAERFLAFEEIPTEARRSGVRFDPLGVVLAIMPWNYPFWQFFRFCAPALAAGNGAILKHASNVPECARLIEEIVTGAGAPAGLVAAPLLDVTATTALIDDARIAAVTLTGSTEVGATVAAHAASRLKKQVLELGGSDPFIVLADADLDAASTVAVRARFTASGQSCVNAKRFVVVEEVADEFVRLFAEKAGHLVTGDPAAEATDVGPLARGNLRDDLDDQVKRSVSAGARVVLGGAPLPGPGYYYAPTILDRVPLDAAAACEETFGPVAAILRVQDAAEAIRVANATEFGLGAALWTSDLAAAEDLAGRVDAGAVFVNAQVASDARLPFGGIKQSGYGRELSAYGLREFVNVKTVYIGK